MTFEDHEETKKVDCAESLFEQERQKQMSLFKKKKFMKVDVYVTEKNSYMTILEEFYPKMLHHQKLERRIYLNTKAVLRNEKRKWEEEHGDNNLNNTFIKKRTKRMSLAPNLPRRFSKRFGASLNPRRRSTVKEETDDGIDKAMLKRCNDYEKNNLCSPYKLVVTSEEAKVIYCSFKGLKDALFLYEIFNRKFIERCKITDINYYKNLGQDLSKKIESRSQTICSIPKAVLKKKEKRTNLLVQEKQNSTDEKMFQVNKLIKSWLGLKAPKKRDIVNYSYKNKILEGKEFKEFLSEQKSNIDSYFNVKDFIKNMRLTMNNSSREFLSKYVKIDWINGNRLEVGDFVSKLQIEKAVDSIDTLCEKDKVMMKKVFAKIEHISKSSRILRMQEDRRKEKLNSGLQANWRKKYSVKSKKKPIHKIEALKLYDKQASKWFNDIKGHKNEKGFTNPAARAKNKNNYRVEVQKFKHFMRKHRDKPKTFMTNISKRNWVSHQRSRSMKQLGSHQKGKNYKNPRFVEYPIISKEELAKMPSNKGNLSYRDKLHLKSQLDSSVHREASKFFNISNKEYHRKRNISMATTTDLNLTYLGSPSKILKQNLGEYRGNSVHETSRQKVKINSFKILEFFTFSHFFHFFSIFCSFFRIFLR